MVLVIESGVLYLLVQLIHVVPLCSTVLCRLPLALWPFKFMCVHPYWRCLYLLQYFRHAQGIAQSIIVIGVRLGMSSEHVSCAIVSWVACRGHPFEATAEQDKVYGLGTVPTQDAHTKTY